MWGGINSAGNHKGEGLTVQVTICGEGLLNSTGDRTWGGVNCTGNRT